MSKVILETSITQIGASATDFLEENMFVFFQENTPAYLAEFCYLIRPGTGSYDIRVGDILDLDGAQCPVTAIGEAALENFRQLGHLTVRCDGAAQAAQPGAMHVRCPAVPPLSVGTQVRFIRG